MKAPILKSIVVTAAIALSACSTYSYAADGYGYASKKVVQKVDTSIGEVFANANGLTLYTFTRDSQNMSNCYDTCATNWPPFAAKKDSKEWGSFTVVERNDGTYQWAYENQPLYTWVGDQQSGDTNGEGLGNVWFALKTN